MFLKEFQVKFDFWKDTIELQTSISQIISDYLTLNPQGQIVKEKRILHNTCFEDPDSRKNMKETQINKFSANTSQTSKFLE